MKDEKNNKENQIQYFNENDETEKTLINNITNIEVCSKENNKPDFSYKLKEEYNKNYIPICKEEGCEGHLKISIDEDRFSINCICENNKDHIYNNIYFETFEKFYLKEIIFQKCFNCSNYLENKDKYKCIECNNIYCSSCFLTDIHIQNNWKNLKLETNDSNNKLVYYDLEHIDSRKNTKIFCFKKFEDKNPDENHIIKANLKKNSIFNLGELREKIFKKAKAFESLIKSIDKWQMDLNKKIEMLKQNLRKEITIIKKLFYNFNQNYMNYSYYSNFQEYFNKIEDYNNKYLKQFMKKYTFKEKTKCIFDLITINQPEIKEINAKVKELFKCGEVKIIKNFIDDLLFCYLSEKSSYYIELLKWDKYKDEIILLKKCQFNYKISYIDFSADYKKIYACYKHNKTVFILNYNRNDKSFAFSNENFNVELEGYYKKCICINDNSLITIDDKKVYSWNKNNLNPKEFINTRNLNSDDELYDICLINEKELLFSKISKITFLNIENFSQDKIIERINCTDKVDSLIVINDYIIVDCIGGVSIISIKSKEIIQFIEFDKKESIKAFKDSIYIFEKEYYLYKYSMHHNNLTLNCKIINKDVKSDYSDNIIINKEDIFIWSSWLYKYQYDNNLDE